MTKLPSGWVQSTLGEIGIWQGGGTPSKSDDYLWRQGTIPWVSPKDMKVAVIEDAQDKLSEAARGHPAFKLVPAGSVLVVTRSGILQHTLPVAVTATEVAINQDLKALIPKSGIIGRFVALQLRAEADRILQSCVKAGTTVESIDSKRLRDFPVKIAPADEQVRIVAKLEPLLARCALVRAELARVERLAARQRRAALSAAFRGVLNRAAKDSEGNLVGWSTVPLSSLIVGRPANGLSPRGASGDRGAMSLRLTATTSGELRLDEAAIKRVDATPPPESKYWLKPGDLLVQRANTLEYVGAAAIFEGEKQTFIYPDLMMRIRIEDELTRHYVWRYINSPTARRYFQDRATGTSGNMPKITGRVLESLPVPLAPREQMRTILDEIDRMYARLEAVKAENRQCSRLVTKLEKAFLDKAFNGRLVKQDAGDEPASTLLTDVERSKSEGEEAKMAKSTTEPARRPSVRPYVERQLETWPPDGMTFEQLRAEAPGSYEELKDLIFELMETRRIGQEYDGRERKMKLVKLS